MEVAEALQWLRRHARVQHCQDRGPLVPIGFLFSVGEIDIELQLAQCIPRRICGFSTGFFFSSPLPKFSDSEKQANSGCQSDHIPQPELGSPYRTLTLYLVFAAEHTKLTFSLLHISLFRARIASQCISFSFLRECFLYTGL